MDHIFIHFPVSGHLGCFPVLAVVNSAVMNMEGRVSFLFLKKFLFYTGLRLVYNVVLVSDVQILLWILSECSAPAFPRGITFDVVIWQRGADPVWNKSKAEFKPFCPRAREKPLCGFSAWEAWAFQAGASTRCCVFLAVVACAARAWTCQIERKVEAGVPSEREYRLRMLLNWNPFSGIGLNLLSYSQSRPLWLAQHELVSSQLLILLTFYHMSPWERCLGLTLIITTLFQNPKESNGNEKKEAKIPTMASVGKPPLPAEASLLGNHRYLIL